MSRTGWPCRPRHNETVLHSGLGYRDDVSVKSRLSWMLSGPARLDEMQRSIEALQHQLNEMQMLQDEQLSDVRASVAVVLDDVTARLSALADADDSSS